MKQEAIFQTAQYGLVQEVWTNCVQFQERKQQQQQWGLWFPLPILATSMSDYLFSPKKQESDATPIFVVLNSKVNVLRLC